ncbi:MAG: DUF1844 domain-containing protein [Ignavibacteria bacterium]|jgi:hypothetical protein|nr:DUF1844 domain-containing protein [Ignavibacteria bacterium]
MEANQLNEILFMQLIYQNQQLGMMGLGKIMNPVSNKTEKNLEQAKLAIDMLDMLVTKTKGNLSPNEEKFIQDVVRNLKLNYVNESK